jgi:tetratricopeptide (TPR) repeat protein
MPPDRLVGRDQELATLVGIIRAAACGHGGAVLIEGEPGIGKSALAQAAVQEALADVADLECQLFWGTGDELGQGLPFRPFLDALRVGEPSASHRRSVIAAFLQGEFSLGPGADSSSVLAEQLLRLIYEECSGRPVILVIDDLQWADQSSIRLLGRLARALTQLSLVLVGIMRPVPHRGDLQSLRRALGERACMKLGGLTQAATAGLVASLIGGTPDRTLIGLANGAAGNPLYITELVAALKRSSAMVVNAAGEVTVTGDAVPGSLTAAIADRLSFVSKATAEALRAAALLGVDFTVSDLASVLDRNVTDLVAVIDKALLAGILIESGTRLRFRHSLIHAALYEAMPLPVRTAWHAQAAQALAKAGCPADRVARQLLRAASTAGGPRKPMEMWVLGWVTDVGDHLVTQAPQVAADLFRWAIASIPAGAARRIAKHGRPEHQPVQPAWLASRLADALYRTGDRTSAEQVASAALTRDAEPNVLIDLHWILGQCRMLAGRSAQSLATLDEALSSPRLSGRHRARLLVLVARTRSVRGELEAADQAAAGALTIAEESGDSWVKAWALSTMALDAMVQGKLAHALSLSDRAVAAAQGDPSLADLRLLVQINKAAALATLGQYHRSDTEAARRHLAEAEPYADRIGPRLVTTLALARSLDREGEGALPEALAELAAWLDGGTEELGQAEDLLADATRLAMRTGDLGLARKLAQYAADFAAEPGSSTPYREANALYCAGLVAGDPDQLRAAADRYAVAHRALPEARAWESAASEYARAGDADRARAAHDKATQAYARLGVTRS